MIAVRSGFFALVLFVAVSLVACTGSNTKETAETLSAGDKSAQQILDPLLDNVQEAVALAGDTWKYPDGKAWDGSDRNVNDYGLGPCTANEQTGPEQFSLSIAGPAVSDPAAATAKFAAVWQKRGHAVKQIGPTPTDDTRSTEISVFLSNGALISYSVSTQTSSIDASSECSASKDVLKLAGGK